MEAAEAVENSDQEPSENESDEETAAWKVASVEVAKEAAVAVEADAKFQESVKAVVPGWGHQALGTDGLMVVGPNEVEEEDGYESGRNAEAIQWLLAYSNGPWLAGLSGGNEMVKPGMEGLQVVQQKMGQKRRADLGSAVCLRLGTEIDLHNRALLFEHLAVAQVVLIEEDSEAMPALSLASKWKKRGRLLTMHIEI